MYFEKDAMAGLWDVIKTAGNDGNVFVINPPSSVGSVAREQHALADEKTGLPRIIGESQGMQRLRKNVHRFSALDCPVIINGETGTGKELAARTIHWLGHRKNQRFLAFDCGCFSRDFCFKEHRYHPAGSYGKHAPCHPAEYAADTGSQNGRYGCPVYRVNPERS